MNRPLTSRTRLTIERRSPGFTEGTVMHGGPLVIDPFLAFTDFHMSEPTFAPHPHAGFSAVTYMFRDSAGSFTNRDSLGDHSRIGPGALHWTQAGAGMMHEEVPVEPGVDCHGLQMFVNLRAEHELAPPAAFHLDADDVPVVRRADGVEIRVVVGDATDARSPLQGLLTAITLLDVELAPGATTTFDVPLGDRAVILVVDGEVVAGDPRAGDHLAQHDVATFDGPEGDLTLTGGASGATTLVLWGAPIAEPVVFGGPFAMTSAERVTAAQQRFARSEMGRLAPSF